MPHIPIIPDSAAGSPDRHPRRPRARTALPDSPAGRGSRPRARHRINAAQRAKYWREWGAAKLVLIRSGDYTPAEADNCRKELHREVLGEDVSSTELNNQQFDAVLAAFAAISRPEDLTAQLNGITGQRRRLIYALRQLAPGREEYIATICSDCYGHRNWTRLSDGDLQRLRITLERRINRRAPKGSEEQAGSQASDDSHNATNSTARHEPE